MNLLAGETNIDKNNSINHFLHMSGYIVPPPSLKKEQDKYCNTIVSNKSCLFCASSIISEVLRASGISYIARPNTGEVREHGDRGYMDTWFYLLSQLEKHNTIFSRLHTGFSVFLCKVRYFRCIQISQFFVVFHLFF